MMRTNMFKARMLVMMVMLMAFTTIAKLCAADNLRIFGSPQGLCQIQYLTIMFCDHTLNHVTIIVCHISQLVSAVKSISGLKIRIPETGFFNFQILRCFQQKRCMFRLLRLSIHHSDIFKNIHHICFIFPDFFMAPAPTAASFQQKRRYTHTPGPVIAAGL